MKTIETVVYEFDELNDKAKEKAREWWREGAFDYPWYDYTQCDFHEFLANIGFAGVESQFSGFWSQGDGASFDFKGLDFSKLFNADCTGFEPYSAVVIEWRELNKSLIRKARRVQSVLTAHSEKNSYGYHYSHARTRYTECDIDYPTECTKGETKRVFAMVEELRVELTVLHVKLGDTFYRALEKEYEYLNSDESVDESIRANEYTFTESGKRFG